MSIIIPDNVHNISSSVFSDCSELTTVVIANGITKIANDTFSNCYALTNFTWKSLSKRDPHAAIAAFFYIGVGALRFLYAMLLFSKKF